MAFCLAAPAIAADVAQPPYEQSVTEQYNACIQLARTQPETTFKTARAWYQETKAIAAQHCMALSLFQMQDYRGAANELSAILKSITPAQGRLWLDMKSQAARAFLLAGSYEVAESHLNEALHWASDEGLDQDMVPLLIQRSRIYALHNENLRAIHDLDHAFSIRADKAVLLERARTFLKMGKFNSAKEDIDAVLKQEPLNEEASILLGKLEHRQKALAQKK